MKVGLTPRAVLKHLQRWSSLLAENMWYQGGVVELQGQQTLRQALPSPLKRFGSQFAGPYSIQLQLLLLQLALYLSDASSWPWMCCLGDVALLRLSLEPYLTARHQSCQGGSPSDSGWRPFSSASCFW